MRSGAQVEMKTMLRYAPLLAVLMGTPQIAVAQIANERILTVYGEDKCPADTICVRAPESERFRIPKQLRNQGVIAPENQSWAARAQATTDAGARTGPGSCTAVGPGGWTGCYMQQMRAARAKAAARGTEQNPDIEP
ncbi:MAG: hypothetical protein ACKVOP_00765 [Sphingomonadaceae bacterium]